MTQSELHTLMKQGIVLLCLPFITLRPLYLSTLLYDFINFEYGNFQK